MRPMLPLLALLLSSPLLAQDIAPNVALASTGATAEATSLFAPSFPAANAIDGTWDHYASSWSSGHGLPQTLTVAFPEAREIRAVRIHADQRPEYRFHLRDYTVEALTPAGEWREVVSAHGNMALMSEHRFDAVQAEAVLLTVTATAGGDDVVRVNEFEVFGAGRLPERKQLLAIGQADGSYAEFAIAGRFGDYTNVFPNDVIYDTSSALPPSLPYILPGPTDAWAGGKQHSAEIRFHLDEAPVGECQLLITLVAAQGQHGQRESIEINGLATEAVFPARGVADAVLSDSSVGVPDAQMVRFDGGLLSRGVNTIRLVSTGGSWALFDSISLTVVEGTPPGPIVALSAVGTPLLKREGGKLLQAVRLTVQNLGREQDATISLTSDGADDSLAQVEMSAAFGTHTQLLLIDPVTEPVSAVLSLSTAGQELTAPVTITPARKWTLYIAPSVHTDIGYTDIQDAVYERQAQNIEDAMRFCDETRYYPRDSQFKWNLEVGWQIDNLRRERGQETVDRVVDYIRRGRMEVSGLYLNELSFLCGHDEVLDMTDRVGRLASEYGVDVRVGTTTDNPTYTWAYPGLLSGSGIRYMAMGCNSTRGPFPEHQDERPPIWWEGYDGSRVLLWFAYGYAHASQFIAEPADMENRVLGFLGAYPAEQYPYDLALAYGGFGDNGTISRAFCDSVREWNDTWAYPRLKIALTSEFFADLDARYGDSIPVRRGDMGGYWEDGAASSAHETALSRETHWQLPLAKTLATARWLDGADYPAEEIDQAVHDLLLYDEHTWGAYNSVSDPEIEFVTRQFEIKAAFAEDSAETTHILLHNAMSVDIPKLHGVVLNPSPVVRSGMVRYGSEPTDGVTYVTDAQPLSTAEAEGSAFPVVEPADGRTVIENRHYRVEISEETGGIVSLLDKQLAQDLVDPSSPYHVNQLIYDAGQPPSPVERQTPVSAHIESVVTTPYSTTIISTTDCGPVRGLRQEVTIYENEKRIDIRNVVEKDLTYDKEAIYFAFPFAVPGGSFRLQGPASVTDPATDLLAGACRDWFSVQDYADISNARFGVTWTSVDAPLVSLCDINTDQWLTDLPITNQTVFSYVMNNYWFTNYKAGQDGTLVFRYSITSHRGPYDAAGASEFGAASCAPLMPWSGGNTLDSVVTLSDERARLLSLSPADPSDRSRVIARVWNVGDEPISPVLTLPGHHVLSAREVLLSGEPVRRMQTRSGAAHLRCAPRRVQAFELTLRQ